MQQSYKQKGDLFLLEIVNFWQIKAWYGLILLIGVIRKSLFLIIHNQNE